MLFSACSGQRNQATSPRSDVGATPLRNKTSAGLRRRRISGIRSARSSRVTMFSLDQPGNTPGEWCKNSVASAKSRPVRKSVEAGEMGMPVALLAISLRLIPRARVMTPVADITVEFTLESHLGDSPKSAHLERTRHFTACCQSVHRGNPHAPPLGNPGEARHVVGQGSAVDERTFRRRAAR